MKKVFMIPERTHGPGPVFFTWQKCSANYLVTTGYDHSVILHNRHGDKVDSIDLPGACSGLSWDHEGDILAMISEKSSLIFMWDSSSHKLFRVDTAIKDVLTLLVWSKSTKILAVATSKGNVLIYNHQTSRKVPILGKHSKKISSGCWSDQNMLALAGDDRIITVSNEEGDTICQCSLKGEASLIHFAKVKWRDVKPTIGENCVSCVLNKKNFFLVDISDPENPYLLAFQEKYGKIVDYQWYGDGYVILGFSTGILSIISTHLKELGQEIGSVRAHPENLVTFTVSISTNRVASSNENVVKFFDINQLEDTKSVLLIEDERAIEWMEWTDDGQLIALASSSGAVHVYLTKLTILGSSFGSRIAYLSSLLEVTIINVSEDPVESMIVLRIDIEPSIIAVGPYHLVVCINNRAWFYAITGTESQILFREKEYSSILKALKLNGDYAAALYTDGRLQLHSIDDDTTTATTYESKMFSDETAPETGKISALSITNEFLIFGKESGSIEFFSLEDWTIVNVYRHSTSIKLIEPDMTGLRLIFIDGRNDVFLYNAIDDHVIMLKDPPEFPTNVHKILWESWHLNKNVFCISDGRKIFIYSYVRDSIYGQFIEYVGKMKLPIGQHSLLLYNGIIVCQTESGKTSNFVLSTHDFSEKMTDRLKLKNEYLRDILKLRRYQDAWKICEYLDDVEAWRQLAKCALIDLNTELAIRVYRKIGDAGMVFSLEKIMSIEERNLLAGHLASFILDFDLAQKMFLLSSKPKEALEMRQNLQDWDGALVLANRLAPELIPLISREYASQLEFQGDYRNALDNYERAIILQNETTDLDDSEILNHNQFCKAGIARTSIRCGNTRRGVEIALELKDDQTLHLKCATILESLKLYPESALLYEVGKNYEKAARIYMNIRNTRKVGELLSNNLVESKDILSRFARIKETEGSFREAISLYRRAGDSINAIRLLLDKANDPEDAVKIVKESKSSDGAKMIARFFQKINDVNSAIEFLVISECNEEAFQLATSTGQVDLYANILSELQKQKGDKFAAAKDFNSLAIYYEQNKNFLMAGKFLCLSGNYQKGVKTLLQVANRDDQSEALKLAVDAASKSKDDQVVQSLIEFLIGETDGEPKDFKFLFRLYMGLRKYKEAAKTALVIAKEEQNAGNYRNGHDLLFGMYRELRKQQIEIPMDMENSLLLLHSYLLAKAWIRVGNHLNSAQLLIRISNNISKFPAHVVPILTSTVIECQRSGLKRQAVHYAAILMKPEYKDKIEPKFRRKFEALVRKSTSFTSNEMDTLDTVIGALTPCPFCDKELLETELTCNQCRNSIPFCIASGHHVIKNDLTFCPSCNFPAIRSKFIIYLENEKICSMCNSPVEISSLVETKETNLLVFGKNSL